MLPFWRKDSLSAFIALTLLAGCGDTVTLPLLASFGPKPGLPPPNHPVGIVLDHD